MIAPGVMPNWGAASVTEIQVTSKGSRLHVLVDDTAAYPNDARGFSLLRLERSQRPLRPRL
jgi:hypothetical protein